VISLAEIDKKIENILTKQNCDELELLGGEIFLYPDKLQYIFTNYHQYFPFILTTNGTIRNKMIDSLITKYKPYMGVSLDDPQTIKRQRIGIDFERVLANAKHWRTLTKVAINAVLNPLNLRRIKETFDFYVLEQGFETIHFGCVEEWMNDYYWKIYKDEAVRLIEATNPDILRRVTISPWKWHKPSKKEFVYEDGLEKIEIFNPYQMELSPYLEAKYYVYNFYCRQIGVQPEPLLPDGIEVIKRQEVVYG
jgi:sulfatase maturation enzyme AslB (radical SAM superfamily)